MTHSLKQTLYDKCWQLVENQLLATKKEIAEAQAVANSESKSSVGDKYETTRAMMQIEIENCTKRLAEQQKLQNILKQIAFQESYSRATLGSVIVSSQGKFFLSAGIGKIEVENEVFFAISQHSPLGEKFYLKEIGEEFVLNGRKYVILALF